MSDYTKSTNFASKDSLSSGNPLKIVKGTEIDTEFNNIATAIATKADLASPAFTGTPTAPTASVGTDTTQVATAALVFAAMQALYPVGSIYSNVSVSTNPATLFGFGTWVALEGVTVIGRSSTDSTFGTAGATGGSKDAIVVSHNHTTSSSGDHYHTLDNNANGAYAASVSNGMTRVASGDDAWLYSDYVHTKNAGSHTHTISTEGSSATNANLPPYVVAYVWKRTA